MLTNRRVLLLTDGHLGVFTSKTATCILRYRPGDVVAMLDRTYAGRDPADIVGVGRGVPIVGSVAEAMGYQPRSLLIGIAPAGGGLPDDWRQILAEAPPQPPPLSAISVSVWFSPQDPGSPLLSGGREGERRT